MVLDLVEAAEVAVVACLVVVTVPCQWEVLAGLVVAQCGEAVVVEAAAAAAAVVVVVMPVAGVPDRVRVLVAGAR